MKTWILGGAAVLMVACGSQANAEIAVSANDGKQNLINNVVSIPNPVLPDSVSIIDFGPPLRILSTVPAPASVTGAPTSVAVAPDGSFALVTGARKFGPGEPPTLVPDDVLSVIAIKDGQARVSATFHPGAGIAGVSINPQGTLALVANKTEGSISVFSIAKGVLTPVSKVTMSADSAPSHPAFYDQGRRALAPRTSDGALALFTIEGDKVTLRPETVALGRGANAIDTVRSGRFAVAGAGGGAAAAASIVLIDLSPDVPVVADRADVKATPESVKLSPDGRYVAVNSHNGSGVLPGAPGYNPEGRLQIFRIDQAKLVKVAEAVSGAWGQGVVWSKDGKRLLVQASKDNRIDAYDFDGETLILTTGIAMPAAPVGFRTAE